MSFRLLATPLGGCRAGLRINRAWSPPAKFLGAELHASRFGITHGPLARRFLQTRSTAATSTQCGLTTRISQTLRTRPTSPAYFSKSFPKPHALFQQHQRFFSSNQDHAFEPPSEPLPPLSPPSVGRWLILSSFLVYAVIIVGGITRLTESGLSITEWRPITGVIPPRSQEEWEAEFTKYKETPEFKLLNSSISLSDFKRIFFWEWSHRVLGRVVGLAFVLPLSYFVLRKRLSPGLLSRFSAMAVLIGGQGLLGWYMVKSGLDNKLLDTPGAVPRVSQYRLAAHLGAAIALYAAMFGTGLTVLRDWKYAQSGLWSGLKEGWEQVLKKGSVRMFKGATWAVTALVFVTALSGAFVAGLDAGLVYNEFPYMGGQLVPPKDELLNPAYATRTDKSDLWWRNALENPTTVQFDHRVLAVATYCAVALLHGAALSPPLRAALPHLTRRLSGYAFLFVNLQAALGISTLLYLVPIPVAAAHQAGSVALLTPMIALAISLRRPSAVAKMWRQWLAMGSASSPKL